MALTRSQPSWLDPSSVAPDEFAWCVCKAWGGNYYICEIGGKLGGVSDEFWKQLAVTAKKWNVNEIAVESNFGGLEIYKQVLLPYLRNVGS